MQWLEKESVLARFALSGYKRVIRVSSHDGHVTDLKNGAEAAKLAFGFQEKEELSKALLSEHG